MELVVGAALLGGGVVARTTVTAVSELPEDGAVSKPLSPCPYLSNLLLLVGGGHVESVCDGYIYRVHRRHRSSSV